MQYPNTPKLTPLKLPRAMDLVIGTDITERSNRTKAASRKTVPGVAARARSAIYINGSAYRKYIVMSELSSKKGKKIKKIECA